ncbi:glycosyltransferase family 2 protein [uncultured Erythrobacter sp.]|uniref:glycosyltransferase family 2 protein n=1 Tax=uncultured Erythrobacter sp. TaxID=263913 RepID=UPI0026121720|nr:glycosyltransferase family 2 protein [uncultured Erythrobacter sp.]
MNALAAIPLQDTDWEVPPHKVSVYANKAHKYALVIPVINEGERIRGQLSRIKDAAPLVDVIVADGGSTDGSLDEGFVKPIGVRAVLTKIGPGKLSAQLRMAYAWCLREGYAGIVTVDGNGKDGVEAVASFVAKLEAGCDYVQGSRYLSGGKAENTPLERTIANRLIHAPILSIAGRNLFTDTTNGFRAYSARYLTHPEVRPFRSEFEVYSLLFYLTVRAGQLGLKVDHVPVVRRYPDSGQVPTKIGGLASKLALLGETVRVATGGYTPDDVRAKQAPLDWPAVVAALVLLPLFLSVIVAPNYSPDSWALYELSKTVFDDFYRFSHFRSFASASEYSSAFAPLWPTLIAVTDGVLGTGARTGLYLAFLSFFAFALMSERIGQQITGARWIGLGTALLLLLGPSMVWDELSAGRTIPLQLLLYALLFRWLLAGRAISLQSAAMIGFVSGLTVMNRFDAALLPFFVTLMIALLTRSPSRSAAALAGSLLAISPWVAYSLSTFGTVFATDNSGIVTALDSRAFVTDWWPKPQATAFEDPAVWAIKVLSNLRQWVLTGLSLVLSPLGFAFALGSVLVGGLQYLCAKTPDTVDPKDKPRTQLWLLVIFAFLLVGLMLPQILTGYLEYRYYSAMFWVGLLTIAAWQISRGVTARQRQTFATLFAGTIGVWLIGFAMIQFASAANSNRFAADQWGQFDAPDDIAMLLQCLGDNSDARILVMGDDNFAARAGALASLSTMMEPRNMAEGRLEESGKAAFLETWQVDYVLVRSEIHAQKARALNGFVPVDECDGLLKRKND